MGYDVFLSITVSMKLFAERSRLDSVDTKKGGRRRPPSGVRPAYLGRITASITWITPLAHAMSVFTTLASSTFTFPSVTVIFAEDP